MPWDQGSLYVTKKAGLVIYHQKFRDCPLVQPWCPTCPGHTKSRGIKVLITKQTYFSPAAVALYVDGIHYYADADNLCGRLEEI